MKDAVESQTRGHSLLQVALCFDAMGHQVLHPIGRPRLHLGTRTGCFRGLIESSIGFKQKVRFQITEKPSFMTNKPVGSQLV